MSNWKLLFITVLLAIAAVEPTRAENADSCSQYSMVVETFIDSTMLYFFAQDPSMEQPHVDSIWIRGTAEYYSTIYLVSYAQPREKIDLSFLERGHYLCYAQIGDCVSVRMFGFRGRTPTGTHNPYACEVQSSVRKVIHNGQLYIVKEGVCYDVLGGKSHCQPLE